MRFILFFVMLHAASPEWLSASGSCEVDANGILLKNGVPILTGAVACGGALIALPSCVVSIDPPNSIKRIAGDCQDASTRRNGPPLYARFKQLGNVFAALGDAFAVAAADELIWGLKGGRGVVSIDVAKSIASLAIQDSVFVVYGDGSAAIWNSEMLSPLNSTALFVAAAAWNGRMYALSHDAVWTIIDTALHREHDIVAVDAAKGSLYYSDGWWFADYKDERRFEVLEFAECRCPPGLLPLQNKCVPPPPGGTLQQAKFVPCAAGYFSIEAGCKRCPPGSIAPFEAAATCAACPLSAPFSRKGVECVSEITCPHGTVAYADECIATKARQRDLPRVFTLATIEDPPISIAGSAQNGTMWVGCSNSIITIITTNTKPFITVRGVPTPVSISLTQDETFLYVYDGVDLARLHSLVVVELIMTVAGTTMAASMDFVFWKSGANSIAVFQFPKIVATVPFSADVVTFAQHPEGGVVVLLKDASLWWLWSTSAFPIVGDYYSVDYTSGTTAAWDNNLIFAKNNAIFFDTLIGVENEAGYVDDAGERARLTAPIFIAGSVIHAGGAVLLFVERNTIRAVYAADEACERDFYFYYYQNNVGACVPCPSNTYAEPGALGCAATISCDATISWRVAPGCRPMRDTLASVQSLMTLAEALRSNQGVVCDFALANIVLGLGAPDMLLRGDSIGRFWKIVDDAPTSTSIAIASTSYITSKLDTNSFWMYCCSPLLSSPSLCVCEFGPMQRWAARPQRDPSELYVLCSSGNIFKIDASVVGSIEISTGAAEAKCWVGWPATYRCPSAMYEWLLPTPEHPDGACRRCDQGSFVSDTACVAMTDPYVCAAGFYLHFLPPNSIQKRVCMRCIIGTFSQEGAEEACMQRTVLDCPIGAYIVLNEDATAEHQCIPCQQCAIDEMPLMITAAAGYINIQDDERSLCTPGIELQPYVCVRGLDSIAGLVATLLVTDTAKRLQYTACADAPPSFAAWAAGPQPGRCYFRCLLDPSPEAESQYYLDSLTQPQDKIFQYVSPDLALCPAVCPPRPNAIYTSRDCDEWRCASGFFLNDTACLPCEAASCALNEAFFEAQCMCIDCNLIAAKLNLNLTRATKRGVCAFDCSNGYAIASDSTPCLPCKKAFCPPGYRYTCAAEPCVPCAEPYNTLGGTAVLAPTHDAVCRVQCKPGYHAVSASGDVVANDAGLDPSTHICEPCSLRPNLKCFFDTCLDNSSTSPDCLPPCFSECPQAKTPPQCIPGLRQASSCIDCPRPAANAFFSESKGCATQCIAGTSPKGKLCVPCPTPPPGYPYAAYYSLFNAKPGKRWWPQQFDPPHLPFRNDDAEEQRAGLCWPCPVGTPYPSPYSTSDEPCSQTATSTAPYVNSYEADLSDIIIQEQQQCPEGTTKLIYNKTTTACVLSKITQKITQPKRKIGCPIGFGIQGAYCQQCPPGSSPRDNYCTLLPPVSNTCNTCQNNMTATIIDCVCACQPQTEAPYCTPCRNGTSSGKLGLAPCS